MTEGRRNYKAVVAMIGVVLVVGIVQHPAAVAHPHCYPSHGSHPYAGLQPLYATHGNICSWPITQSLPADRGR